MNLDDLILQLQTQRAIHGGKVDVVYSWSGDGALPYHSQKLDVIDCWSDGPDKPVHTLVLGATGAAE